VRRAALFLAFVGIFFTGRYLALRDTPPVVDRTTPEWARRVDALSRAAVFPRASDLEPSPPPVHDGQPLECTYVPGRASGTTPKFDCRLGNGEVVKVKYGDNPEIPAEIAATRLLRTLGFASDNVWPVAELRCTGCPPHPYRTRQLAEMLFLARLQESLAASHGERLFRHVAVERKFEAPPIEAGDVEGWDWSELELVNSRRGGATRAELDALRLTAVLLAHWDNKPSNQRLVCLDPRRNRDDDDDIRVDCRRPLLMIHDLGATFGPKKLNHAHWSETPLWAPDVPCVATMASLPYAGATFRPHPISDEGRALLAARLAHLSDADLHRLFRDAGFPHAVTGEPRSGDVSEWVRTLRQKAADITHPSCASAS
jgi:hypothetical protein